MKVIIVKPFTNPFVKEITGDLESMQAVVGGYIQAIYPFDDEKDVISVAASNYDVIEWIADGEIIATGETLNLREYSDEIGCYVRFQIKNKGGIVCSQPFVCDDGDMSDEAVELPEDHVPNNIIAAFFQELLSFLRRTLIGEVIYDNLFL